MAEVRTVVTFQSTAFNTTEPEEGVIEGEDVARALMEQLRLLDVQTDTEPGQEDFGWYFGFRSGDTNYQFVIGLRPGDGNEPDVWIGWLERNAGIVGSIFGARQRGIQSDCLRTIHSAISALPQVSNIRWHWKKDFEAGREELGQSDPTL